LRVRFDAMPAVVGVPAPISNIATVTPPLGTEDPNLGNNVAIDGPDVRGVFRNGFEALPPPLGSGAEHF